ncbi:PREDICTED: neuronal growth regulator 1-like, partial [Nicrophorus vespilloides]|uniref:Neuronal growth regulator 1-like n=1 Tax=Nicrophorus vespilloides TaxID=110193 RepID=A0ABM1M422_NICVS
NGLHYLVGHLCLNEAEFPTKAITESSQATIKVDPATLPTFRTSSQVFKITDKDTVILPCEVSNPGHYVLAWKRGIAVLSAGNVKVSPDPRISLVNGYSLEIKEAGPQDAGDYVCQIGTLEPREITHTVEILVPPRIHYVTSNGRVEVKKGTSVRLECKASGNPVPKITWSRRNNLLPGGEQTTVTPVLTLDRVDRHQAGVYQCTASNGVGEDVSQQIVLHVLSTLIDGIASGVMLRRPAPVPEPAPAHLQLIVSSEVEYGARVGVRVVHLHTPFASSASGSECTEVSEASLISPIVRRNAKPFEKHSLLNQNMGVVSYIEMSCSYFAQILPSKQESILFVVSNIKING